MCLSTSQIETISTGATWTKRQRSLLPYHPAPIKPTRFGFPFMMSRASAPNADKASVAPVVCRNRRRLMLKAETDAELFAFAFIGAQYGSTSRQNAIPEERGKKDTR